SSTFFFQAEDGIRDRNVTGVQTCALPIYHQPNAPLRLRRDVPDRTVHRRPDDPRNRHVEPAVPGDRHVALGADPRGGPGSARLADPLGMGTRARRGRIPVLLAGGGELWARTSLNP